eukprot:Gb_18523 [translate_table: standard]
MVFLHKNLSSIVSRMGIVSCACTEYGTSLQLHIVTTLGLLFVKNLLISLPASTSANPIVPNGSSGYVQPSQTSRGSWSTLTEHPTIADGKSTNVSQSPMEIQSAEPASTSTTVQGQLMPNCQPYTTLAPANSVSGVYSPSSDPVLLPSLALRVSGVVGTIKREVGMVGTQRPSSEHSVGSLAVESSSFSCNLSESLQLTQSSTQNADVSTGNSSGNEKFISATVLPLLQDGTVKKSKQLNGDHLSEKQSWASTSSTLGASVRRSSFMGNHYSSRSQHQPVGHLKVDSANASGWGTVGVGTSSSIGAFPLSISFVILGFSISLGVGYWAVIVDKPVTLWIATSEIVRALRHAATISSTEASAAGS